MPEPRLPPPARSLPAPVEPIERRIFLVRGLKIMLDSDLAELYQVETKALNRAVKRNLDRFPEDFMFQLVDEEAESLRCQIGASSSSYGGRRYLPYAFTEHGVAMLSSVLHSRRAAQMSILIVRAFVKLRELLATHKELAGKIERIEATQEQQAHTQQRHASILVSVVQDIQKLKKPADRPRHRVRYPQPQEEVVPKSAGARER
ncbi:MAG: ORF6N domain-containing protein [Bryobacteraceae bacterium]|jgi:phage regulator Rha-like protein